MKKQTLITAVCALLIVAIAAFFDDIVFDKHLCRAHTHEVGDGDTAGMVLSPTVNDLVADDADRVSAARTKVELWAVDAVHIGIECVIQDLW